MTPEDEKKLFELEQQLDIPYKDRYYNKDDKHNYEAEQPVKNCNIPCVNIALENKRKAFCIWYYAQSQPLDANKVFDWFSNEC